jgi:hypothetical protein
MSVPRYKIVFVVCHPDDEALWVGGLISEISKYVDIEVTVICVSGKDADSPREAEFHTARQAAGYHKGIVLGGKLRKLLEVLPYIPQTTLDGLNKLGIEPGSIDLLVTHPPYGDEHMSPHHRQASRELYYWCKKMKIPFGYFSFLPMPSMEYATLLKNFKRKNNFFLLNFFKCRVPFFSGLLTRLIDGGYMFPGYYLQFLVSMQPKTEMLMSYQSINLEEHANGYAMFHSNCESLYVMNKKGLLPLRHIISQMDLPGPQNVFVEFSNKRIMLSKIYRKFFRKQ